MIACDRVSLHDEIAIFAELAAVRISTGKVDPWQDDLYMPAIARPQARTPPARPRHRDRQGAGEELAKKVWLGSADTRVWVVQAADAEQPADRAGKCATEAVQARTPQTASEKEAVQAYLCHKYLLKRASRLLSYKINRAEEAGAAEASSRWAKSRGSTQAKLQARLEMGPLPGPSASRRLKLQKLRVARAQLLELELRVHAPPGAFANILALLYGMPMKVRPKDVKRWCSKAWWPELGVAQELQLRSVETCLRTVLVGLLQHLPWDSCWALLPLAHAHGLQEETALCCEVLARRGGEVPHLRLRVVQDLPLNALSHLLSCDAWVASSEAQVFGVLEAWLKSKPWADSEEKKAPAEIFAASAEWGIRWGLLHSRYLEKLVSIGIIPETLVKDVDRWRASTGVVLPPIAPKDESQISRDDSLHAGPRPSMLLEQGGPRSGKKRSTKRGSQLKRRSLVPSDDDPQSSATRAMSEAIRIILAARVQPGSSVPVAPETTEWRTQSVQLGAAISQADAFLQGTCALCDAVDTRFGVEHPHRLALQLEHKEEEVSEDVKAARKLAGRRVAYIPPSCPWMNRRRCFHTDLVLPRYGHYFSRVVRGDHLTMYCRGARSTPPERSRSLQEWFTTSAETQQRTPSSTSNHSNLDEAMKSVVEEGEEGDEGDEGEEGEDVEVECAQPSVEAMMSEILPVEGPIARLTSNQQISSGRHEFLFRVLVSRPDPSDSQRPLAFRAVAAAFAEAFQVAVAIYAHPSNPAATGMALTPDVAELAITSSSAGHSQQNRRQSLAGTLTEVVRLRPEQLMAAIEDCLPVHWPPGGLLDAFLLVVLEPHQKEMKIAVDATFTKPFGVEAEEEPPQDEPEQGCDFPDSRPAAMDPMHFVQERRFLRRWRFEECLKQDLKTGIVLANAARSAGMHPLFLPIFEVNTEALCSLGGPGGKATVELLPHGALRPSWWIDLMGNTLDMPRPP